MYYTYAYLREDRTPYYIGKGKGNRAYKKRNRVVLPPPKNRILILKQNLTEEEAFKHEKYMIAIFGRKDLGTGILRNLTDGGEGLSNPSEQTRKKKSEIAKKQMANRSPEEKRKASENAKQLGYKLLKEKRGVFALTTEEKRAIAKRIHEQGKGFASIPMENRIEHGKRVIQQQKETNTGIFGVTSEQRSEINKQIWKRRKEQGLGSRISPEKYKEITENQKKNKTGLFSLTDEQRKEIGRKAGQQNKENKVGIHGLTKEQRSEMRKKEHSLRDPEEKRRLLNKAWEGNKNYWANLTKEQRSELAKKQYANIPPDRRSNNQKWQCTETGYVTSPGGLSRYQKKRGIDTSKRIRLS